MHVSGRNNICAKKEGPGGGNPQCKKVRREIDGKKMLE